MAQVTRINGSANGVVNMDISLAGISSLGKIIATGLTKHPVAYKITLAAVGDMSTDGNVEQALRILQVAASTTMYQVDADQLSVLVESTGFATDADVLAALGALATAVTSAAGFKLA
jgi:hypothetical protein